eukprot:TRINITY_DN3022_c0_g1_i1.p1 TRINITY_DN3022_c0_g1~~TRINITY_DN3022_c0_g1_i1.p1  ORF type:complete len:172 (-),score=32.58 TRINITY_DN3022_c0_g1_i1:26-541(-)
MLRGLSRSTGVLSRSRALPVAILRADATPAPAQGGGGWKKNKGKGKEKEEEQQDTRGTANVEKIFPLFANMFRRPTEKIKRSPEEVKRASEIVGRYNKKMQERHALKHKEFSTKIRCMWEAIYALPPSLREAAATIDPTPLPYRPPLTLTPPIPGFAEEEEKARAKQRSKL